MYGHQCSQVIPAFAAKLHKLNFCEGMRGLRRDMLWLWPVGTDNAEHKKDFLFSEKKARLKKNNYFRKVVIFNSIPDALRDSHTSKYKRPRNKNSDGCLWKPAKRNNARTTKQFRFVASKCYLYNTLLTCTRQRATGTTNIIE